MFQKVSVSHSQINIMWLWDSRKYTHIFNHLLAYTTYPVEGGADPSFRWVKGGVHPGQAESLSQRHTETDNHSCSLSHLRGNLKLPVNLTCTSLDSWEETWVPRGESCRRMKNTERLQPAARFHPEPSGRHTTSLHLQIPHSQCQGLVLSLWGTVLIMFWKGSVIVSYMVISQEIQCFCWFTWSFLQ